MLSRIADFTERWMSAGMLAKSYHTTPLAMRRAIREGRFRQTIQYAARHSEFYRNAFAARGIDPAAVRRPDDLGDFYTTPDDLVANPTSFLCQPPSIVFESSGTSGRNKQVYYSEAELREIGRMLASGMHLGGITPKDRIANAFDFSMWIPGMLAHYCLMATGTFCMAFGKVDPIEVYRRLDEYKFNIIMGEPTWLIRLTELAEQHGRFPLRMLIGAAEEMPSAAIPWMREVWGGAEVHMCYGAVEQGGTLGFQPCAQTEEYHLDDLNFLSETVDHDAEGFGELVFTTLRRRVMPLIRYRTRDVTKLLEGNCPSCGGASLRMTRLRGRRDELVVASGGNLYPKMFENILEGIPALELDWQIVFRLEGIREILEVNVESVREDHEAIEKEFHREATLKYPDLMKNLALGIFDLRVIVHRPGEVRVARKLKRILDLRHFSGAEEEPAAPDLAGAGANGKS